MKLGMGGGQSSGRVRKGGEDWMSSTMFQACTTWPTYDIYSLTEYSSETYQVGVTIPILPLRKLVHSHTNWLMASPSTRDLALKVLIFPWNHTAWTRLGGGTAEHHGVVILGRAPGILGYLFLAQSTCRGFSRTQENPWGVSERVCMPFLMDLSKAERNKKCIQPLSASVPIS